MSNTADKTPAQLALWYVERHLESPISLEHIAEVVGVSRFHLARAFSAAMGRPVLNYVRARRLSAAARRLADGASDILSLALESGYGSHEAFTRAFREQFGATPESVRERGHTRGLALQEAKIMQTQLIDLPPPRFVETAQREYAGLSAHYTHETSGNIPSQWQRFIPWIDRLPAREPSVAYGVIFNATDEGDFDYLSGVEVETSARVPAGIVTLETEPQDYAVFAHSGHITDLRSVCHTIWNQWLPRSGKKAAPAPMLEYYGTKFDARTGEGGFEIWLPLA